MGRKVGTIPNLENLEGILSFHGIVLPPGGLERLWKFHNLLRARNQDRDLTRIIGFESMVVKHYVDSLYVRKVYPLPNTLMDLGTGAGFPGIPLKIAEPDLQLVLAEPRPRRVEFLKEACQLLGFKGVTFFSHAVTSRSCQLSLQGVITRAVETMDKTFLRTSACLGVGDKFYFLKGPNVEGEKKEFEKAFRPHLQKLAEREYRIGLQKENHRRLLVYEKTTERDPTFSSPARPQFPQGRRPRPGAGDAARSS